jgi:hypothetical protein
MDIISEVLNDHKQEKRLLWFYKWFPMIMILIIIGAIGIYVENWYGNKQKLHDQSHSDAIITILFDNKLSETEAINQLQTLIEDIDYKKQIQLMIIALNNKISSHHRNDNNALTRVESMLNNGAYNYITGAYLRLIWLSILLDQDNISEAAQIKVEEYTRGFDNQNQVFSTSVILLKALFYQKIDQKALARKYAELVITRDNVPIILKEYANSIIFNLNNIDN